jgi:hypothetical protein
MLSSLILDVKSMIFNINFKGKTNFSDVEFSIRAFYFVNTDLQL